MRPLYSCEKCNAYSHESNEVVFLDFNTNYWQLASPYFVRELDGRLIMTNAEPEPEPSTLDMATIDSRFCELCIAEENVYQCTACSVYVTANNFPEGVYEAMGQTGLCPACACKDDAHTTYKIESRKTARHRYDYHRDSYRITLKGGEHEPSQQEQG
jgi:hypothetical protein